MATKSFLIYGAGGFAREVAWLIEACSHQTLAFIDDNPARVGQVLNDIPVISFDSAQETYTDSEVVVAIGSPQTRQMVSEKVLARGFKIGTLIHPRIEKSRWVTIAEGAVICAGNILTTNITLDKHVQINLDCTIGHDVIMREYVTLAPGVHISGHVHLHERAYVGTGAVIINGTQDNPIIIGADAVIGAGACVTKSVPAGVTVVGVPAKPLNRS